MDERDGPGVGCVVADGTKAVTEGFSVPFDGALFPFGFGLRRLRLLAGSAAWVEAVASGVASTIARGLRGRWGG